VIFIQKSFFSKRSNSVSHLRPKMETVNSS